MVSSARLKMLRPQNVLCIYEELSNSNEMESVRSLCPSSTNLDFDLTFTWGVGKETITGNNLGAMIPTYRDTQQANTPRRLKQPPSSHHTLPNHNHCIAAISHLLQSACRHNTTTNTARTHLQSHP